MSYAAKMARLAAAQRLAAQSAGALNEDSKIIVIVKYFIEVILISTLCLL